MKKFLLLVAFTISCFFVYTLNTHAEVPTGEQYSEFWQYKVELLKLNTANSSVTLYGYDNPNASISGIDMPDLSDFLDGRTSLVRYIDPENDQYGNWAIFVYRQDLGVGTYLMSWKVEFVNNNSALQFCQKASKPSSVRNGVINSFSCSTNGNTSYIALNFTLNSPIENNLVDFAFAEDGMSVNWFLRLVTNVYYPQITPSIYLDTESIINQNNYIISQNNETNIKLDSINDTQKDTNKKLDKTNEELGKLNDNLNNDNTDEASNEASEFFSGFDTDTFGLTSIITAPLNLIGSITSSTCSPLGLEVPFVDTTLNLPCMTSIYQRYFGSFLTVYQTITFGIIAYWVCVRIFALVKDFKNPDHDEIEVMDL